MQRSRLMLSMAFLLRNRSFLSAHSKAGGGRGGREGREVGQTGSCSSWYHIAQEGRSLLCAGLDHTS